jgi:hypothetical protein
MRLVLVVVALAACGQPTVHCNYRTAAAAPQPYCTEWTGADVEMYKAGCPGTGSDGPCTRVDALGGCQRRPTGLVETTWYYKDPSKNLNTMDNVRAICTAGGATIGFVPP